MIPNRSIRPLENLSKITNSLLENRRKRRNLLWIILPVMVFFLITVLYLPTYSAATHSLNWFLVPLPISALAIAFWIASKSNKLQIPIRNKKVMSVPIRYRPKAIGTMGEFLARLYFFMAQRPKLNSAHLIITELNFYLVSSANYKFCEFIFPRETSEVIFEKRIHIFYGGSGKSPNYHQFRIQSLESAESLQILVQSDDHETFQTFLSQNAVTLKEDENENLLEMGKTKKARPFSNFKMMWNVAFILLLVQLAVLHLILLRNLAPSGRVSTNLSMVISLSVMAAACLLAGILLFRILLTSGKKKLLLEACNTELRILSEEQLGQAFFLPYLIRTASLYTVSTCGTLLAHTQGHAALSYPFYAVSIAGLFACFPSETWIRNAFK